MQPAADGHVPAYGFPARSYAEDLAAWPGDSSESGRALPVLQVLWLNAAAMLFVVLHVLRIMWQPGLNRISSQTGHLPFGGRCACCGSSIEEYLDTATSGILGCYDVAAHKMNPIAQCLVVFVLC